jgi:hypothetical protein
MANGRFCVIPARALGDKRLKQTEILVLNALVMYGDRTGWCFPSTRTIGELIRVHRTSVSRAIGTLTACGYIEVRQRKREDGGQTSNEYRILFDAEDYIDEAPPVAPESQGGDSHAAPPVAHQPPAPVTHQPPHINAPSLMNKINDISPERGKNSYPDEFEKFWLLWPKARRCEKQNAYRQWKQATKSEVHPDILLNALKRYLLTKEAMDGFAPYPGRWLKAKRWEEHTSDDDNPLQEAFTLEKLGGDTPNNRKLLALFKAMEARIGEKPARTWFKGMNITTTSDNDVIFTFPSRFIVNYILTHYSGWLFQEANKLWQNRKFEIIPAA